MESDEQNVNALLQEILAKKAPFQDYIRLREESPILWDPQLGWVVLSYRDVDRLFHEPRLSSVRTDGFRAAALPAFREQVTELVTGPYQHWLMMLDDPAHRALRKHLQPYFSERAVAELVPMIETAIQELLGPLPEHGRMDFAQEFAYRLPVYVISGLLAVPREAYERVLEWSDAVASYFNVMPPTPETSAAFVASSHEMLAFFRELMREPQGLLGKLARDPELSEDVILASGVVLLVAGHETTRNLLGSLTSLLLAHPDQWELLRREPERWPQAIEEALRYEPPNPVITRLVAEDFTYEGCPFKQGQMVLLNMGSANRDPAFVPDPERFDITRRPGKHLGFGSGPHFCLGAILARKEAALAMPAVMARMPELRLAPDQPEEWIHQAGMRGPRSLPVLW